MCDVALDPYTSHGHDGIIKKNEILNDETLEILIKQSILQAKMGCDVIAPSDMMDGRVLKIRKALDKNNLKDVQILSYAVKYASSFYGPFRNAVGSRSLLKGDKKTYQMDFKNNYESLREVALDIKEGADMIIVKPGMPYLDIIREVKNNFKIPVIAYQVSGEYSIIQNAISKNREVMGATNPADAASGTIRAEFAESVGENSVHGSDAPETAAVEISYFFSGIELVG